MGQGRLGTTTPLLKRLAHWVDELLIIVVGGVNQRLGHFHDASLLGLLFENVESLAVFADRGDECVDEGLGGLVLRLKKFVNRHFMHHAILYHF